MTVNITSAKAESASNQFPPNVALYKFLITITDYDYSRRYYLNCEMSNIEIISCMNIKLWMAALLHSTDKLALNEPWVINDFNVLDITNYFECSVHDKWFNVLCIINYFNVLCLINECNVLCIINDFNVGPLCIANDFNVRCVLNHKWLQSTVRNK